LVCAGIALPAVWSAKPARRKAAAHVLGHNPQHVAPEVIDDYQPDLPSSGHVELPGGGQRDYLV
jgi:hypothetical protein